MLPVQFSNNRLRRVRGISIIEVLVAILVMALVFSSALFGYIQSARRAEWSAYSLAAHSLAMQRIEQARSCKWDTLASPVVDELVSANFPDRVEILDVPISGTNVVYATNAVTITEISSDPPLKMIQSECTWSLMEQGPFTNSLVVYRAPDQ